MARRPLELPHGTWLAGYPNPFRAHRSVRDPLSLTVLALEGEGQGAAASEGLRGGARSVVLLASMDLLAIHDALASALRTKLAERTGVPPEAIALTCIHSHSSPLGSALASSPPAQHAFLAHLEAQLLSAADEAVRALAPATLGRATGRVVIGHNRREVASDGRIVIGTNPDGPLDPDLDVLVVRAEGGRPLATLVNHACHPTILSPLNRRASAEWPGEMRRHMEARGAGTVLFLQGATGDVDPNHRWLRGGDAAVTRLGRTVAEAALALVEGPLEPVANPCVGAQLEVLPLALDVPAGDPASAAPADHQTSAAAEDAPRGPRPSTSTALRAAPRSPALPRHARELSRQTRLPARWADPLLDRMYPWAPTAQHEPDGAWVAPLTLQSLRLGDVALTTCGAELFTTTGQRIKAASPAARTLVVGYANGMLGYIPPAEDHALGGYEVEMSPFLYRLPGLFTSSSESALRTALVQQLDALFAA
ncbi:MAG: hypothetical protein R3B40_28145 [Polyangiales bacterium]